MFSELFSWLIAKAMGLGTPKLQFKQRLRYRWRRLWGDVPKFTDLDVIDGYMYSVFTYEDGEKLYLR
jgi:hypothetical protein